MGEKKFPLALKKKVSSEWQDRDKIWRREVQKVNLRQYYGLTYIKKGCAFEFVEARVEETKRRQAFRQPLIIDER